MKTSPAGELVEYLMRKYKLTSASLAEKLKTSPATVRMVKTSWGNSAPSAFFWAGLLDTFPKESEHIMLALLCYSRVNKEGKGHGQH